MTDPAAKRAEARRLEEDARRQKNWKRWGPYLAERAWGTVREDYSPDGAAWDYFPHHQAPSKTYRWNEDGIAGICDRHQYVCFALAFWNGRDPILKERLFGLAGPEGNHGEDVKECYFYLDSTPTHSYMKCLYKYPQAEFPYSRLVEENGRRGRNAPEFELVETGVFDQDRYFDVFAEYAKGSPNDLLIRLTAVNRGPETATLHLLPTVWYRNVWSWGSGQRRSRLWAGEAPAGRWVIELDSDYYGRLRLYGEGKAELLFTENETNFQKLYGVENESEYVKDAFHERVIRGAKEAVNPSRRGSKGAAWYALELPPGGSSSVRLRLTDETTSPAGASGGSRKGPRVSDPFDAGFEEIFSARLAEADEFYRDQAPPNVSEDARSVQRQAFAGLLWSKQFYYYDVARWLRGDPGQPPPPAQRYRGRNHDWTHLYNADVLSMPDKWEYPWYAAWDLAFHCIPLATIDPDFAKQQLVLLLREWYMHPNGQLPAYEWAFSDVNPPVHAWAAWRVYKIDAKRRGEKDRRFLERVFHKMLLNFTWWVNRKDTEGRNVFQGGFLGLDNIGVFDRSKPLPTGGYIEQSDGTSWMGMFCLNMLAIALELAEEDPAYEDVASKFFEHFVYICRAMNERGGFELWNEQDGFFYDLLHLPDGRPFPMKIRSMVGLIPLFAVETLESDVVDKLPGFKRRMQWFIENRPDFGNHVETETTPDGTVRRFLSLVNRDRLRSVLRYLLDEKEFLSPHGVRALSRHHLEHPYSLNVDGQEYRVDYEPAESKTGVFGGNSNWRGPVWFPVNYLIIESLQKFHHYLGDGYQVEIPTGSGRTAHLWDVAVELSRRLTHLFLRDGDGRRPIYGGTERFQSDPHFRDYVLFYEYFHGDNGAGLGASHQTGWTGLVAKLIQQSGE